MTLSWSVHLIMSSQLLLPVMCLGVSQWKHQQLDCAIALYFQQQALIWKYYALFTL